MSYRAVKLVRRKPAAVIAGSICAIAVASVASWLSFSRPAPELAPAPAAQPATASIAVLPFKNLTGNPEREIFADGLTDSLIGSLSKIENLKVISRNSVSGFKGRDVDPRQVGRQLNVATILEGSVRENGDKIRVEARLVNTANGEVIWSGGSYERPIGDVFEIQDYFARTTVAELRLKLSPASRERFTRRQTNNVQAYQAYVTGREFWKRKDRGNLEKAKKFFEEAIRLDPSYALAYDGLANYYASSLWYGEMPPAEAARGMKAAVAKLVELDPDAAEAHAGLARVAWFEWDWSTHRRELERAVQLAPNDAAIWHNYAIMLNALLNGREGQEAALAALRQAQELDPLSPSINEDTASILSGLNRFDEAFAIYEKIIETHPEFPAVYYSMFRAYEAKGMHREAIDAFLKAQQLQGVSPEKISALQAAHQREGPRGLRRQLLEHYLEQADRGMNRWFIVATYAYLGDKEKTLEWLAEVYRVRDSSIISLKDPVFRFLHDDPRFQDLMRRVGLPE